MLNKLKALREEREEGFTLIELLVVILIIGILAAIAIPVFLNQRQTANDGAVQADLKNAVTQVESWAVAQGGTDKALAAATFSDMKPTTGVHLAFKGTINNYCLVASHDNGKQYVGYTATTLAALTDAATTPKVLTYDNSAGGLGKGGGAGAAFSGNCKTITGAFTSVY